MEHGRGKRCDQLWGNKKGGGRRSNGKRVGDLKDRGSSRDKRIKE